MDLLAFILIFLKHYVRWYLSLILSVGASLYTSRLQWVPDWPPSSWPDSTVSDTQRALRKHQLACYVSFACRCFPWDLTLREGSDRKWSRLPSCSPPNCIFSQLDPQKIFGMENVPCLTFHCGRAALHNAQGNSYGKSCNLTIALPFHQLPNQTVPDQKQPK